MRDLRQRAEECQLRLYRPPVDRCRATYLNRGTSPAAPYALIPLVVDEETGKIIGDDGCPVLDGATLPEVAEYLRVHGDRIGRARRTVNQAALAVRAVVPDGRKLHEPETDRNLRYRESGAHQGQHP
jgi:hypothetical protein